MSALLRKPAVLLLAVGTLVFGGPVLAADELEGQKLFKEHCKQCHEDGSPNGEYTPMTLISSQWIRFFERKYERTHKDVIDAKHGEKPVIHAISPEDLEVIKNFAIEHAADSENPMTCG